MRAVQVHALALSQCASYTSQKQFAWSRVRTIERSLSSSVLAMKRRLNFFDNVQQHKTNRCIRA